MSLLVGVLRVKLRSNLVLSIAWRFGLQGVGGVDMRYLDRVST